MTTTEGSARAKANGAKGKRAEAHLAAWLRDHGWPTARRAVAVGTSLAADPGDIAGTDCVWSVKDQADRELYRAESEWLDDLDAMGGAGPRLLVVKARQQRPAMWWAWCRLGQLAPLLFDDPPSVPDVALAQPVRMRVGALITLLHAAGYGTAPPPEGAPLTAAVEAAEVLDL